jgi:hypothetical protein
MPKVSAKGFFSFNTVIHLLLPMPITTSTVSLSKEGFFTFYQLLRSARTSWTSLRLQNSH